MKQFWVILLVLIISLVSCKKDKIGPQFKTDSPLEGYKVLISNEGNFGSANASITTYNPYSKKTANNAYIQANGVQIGDVLQSSVARNGKYYICVNNSSKLVIVDSATLQLETEITGFNSPRYIKFYNNKAYVSDLYQGGIYVVDLTSNQITGFISTEGGTSQMVIHNNYLYAIDGGNVLNNQGNNKLYKINLAQNTITDSIILPSKQPRGLVKDYNNKLWVLLAGGINDSIPYLVRVNPTNLAIEQSFNFSSNTESPASLRINGAGNKLYFLNKGVYEMSIIASGLPASPLINQNGRNFYGLNIHPLSGDIYVTDAKNYNEIGEVYRYFPNGNEIDSFSVGIIPQYIQF